MRCGTAAIAAGEKKSASVPLRKRHAPAGQSAPPSASAKYSPIITTWRRSIAASDNEARYHKRDVAAPGRAVATVVTTESTARGENSCIQTVCAAPAAGAVHYS